MKGLMLALLMLVAVPASAVMVCTNCGYDEGAEATHLGTVNPETNDTFTFHHSGVPVGPFTDTWVFDVMQTADGSISADYTALASIASFTATLHSTSDATCDERNCTVTVGEPVATATLTDSRWEILLDALPPGTYALRVMGEGNARNGGTYGGQAGFAPISVDEPATAWLFVGGVLLVVIVLGYFAFSRRKPTN